MSVQSDGSGASSTASAAHHNVEVFSVVLDVAACWMDIIIGLARVAETIYSTVRRVRTTFFIPGVFSGSLGLLSIIFFLIIVRISGGVINFAGRRIRLLERSFLTSVHKRSIVENRQFNNSVRAILHSCDSAICRREFKTPLCLSCVRPPELMIVVLVDGNIVPVVGALWPNSSTTDVIGVQIITDQICLSHASVVLVGALIVVVRHRIAIVRFGVAPVIPRVTVV